MATRDLKIKRGRQRHLDANIFWWQIVGFAKSGPRNNLTRILENPTRSLYSKNESKQFLYKANDIPGTHHRNTKKYPGIAGFRCNERWIPIGPRTKDSGSQSGVVFQNERNETKQPRNKKASSMQHDGSMLCIGCWREDLLVYLATISSNRRLVKPWRRKGGGDC